MTAYYTEGNINWLKSQAKLLSSMTNTKHSKALDEIAQNLGFKDWARLLHTGGPDAERACIENDGIQLPPPPSIHEEDEDAAPAAVSDIVAPKADVTKKPSKIMQDTPLRPVVRPAYARRENRLEFVRSPAEMDQYMKTVELYSEHIPDDISREFSDADNILSFAIDYMKSLLNVRRLYVSDRSVVFGEMRHWLPFHIVPLEDDQYVILNCYRRPVGFVSADFMSFNHYEHLFARISERQRTSLFIFAEVEIGIVSEELGAPWSSRKAAVDYLEQLTSFRAFLLNGDRQTVSD